MGEQHHIGHTKNTAECPLRKNNVGVMLLNDLLERVCRCRKAIVPKQILRDSTCYRTRIEVDLREYGLIGKT